MVIYLGRFNSYATVYLGRFQAFLSGVLITPNVVLFGSYDENLTVNQIKNVTIGRNGDLDIRDVSRIKLFQLSNAGFFENMTFGLAVLDSASTKAPATIDAGNCAVTDGCLEVSVVGRGETSYYVEETPNPDLGLDQPLQQADFTLLDDSSCLNHFDREKMYYDWYIRYNEVDYGCPGLDCANKTRIVNIGNKYNDLYIDDQRAFIDSAEASFQSGKATCLKNLDAGICTGDYGAPVFTEDDILVGIILTDLCYYDGVLDVVPASVTFTAGILATIETELAGLAGANPSLTKAADGGCSCTSSAISFSPSAFLLLLTSSVLTILTLV